MCSNTYYNVDKLGEFNKERNMNQFVKRKYTAQSWNKIPGNTRKIRNKEHLLVWQPYHSYHEKDKKQHFLKLLQKLFF